MDPEVWFRVVHLAQNGHNSAPVAVFREQMVEIVLGPKRVFENGNIGTLTHPSQTDAAVGVTPGI